MENEKSLMSRLYEMQDTYAFEQTSIDNTIPHCIINANKRTITVPEEIKSLGVQYDHRSNIVVFEIDRYIDDVDLLTQTCIIQWMNFNDTKENVGLYPVTSIDFSVEGKLIFTWEIHNESTQLPGTIAFAVRFYSMQDENSFLWSYNTLPAQSTILDTLDVVVRSSTDIEPSILMAWTERMAQLEQVARDAINVSSQSAKEAEAWAHGRADYPSLALDNAKYYAEMTRAVYDDAKESIETEKNSIVNEIYGVRDDVVASVNETKDSVISEVNETKDNVISEVNETKNSVISEVTTTRDECVVQIENAAASAVQIVTNASDAVKDLGDEIIEEVQQYGTVQVSEEEPTSEHVDVWINPGEDVEISIPEIKDDIVNYEDTWSSAKIKEELSSTSNAITCDAYGKSIVVTDSSNVGLKGLRIFGKTEQFTTTGKNLFNPENVRKGYILADSFAITEDTRTTYVFCKCEPDTYYTVTKTVGARFAIACSTTNPYPGTLITCLVSDTSKESLRVLTPSDAAYLIAYVHHTAYDTISLEEMLASVQIEKGNEATFYEPYTGGIPSPNPQYPQELMSVGDDGDVEVGVYGKNLFDPTNTLEGLYFFGTNAAINPINGATSIYCPCEPNTTYTISKTVSARFVVGYTVDIPVCYGNVYGNIENHPVSSITITTGSDAKYLVAFIHNSSQDTIPLEAMLASVQIEKGSAASSYEPYKAEQSLSISTPSRLPAVPVTDASLATYTDANGQMWCADEIDFDRGVYVKRVGVKELTSALSWKKSTNTSIDRYLVVIDNEPTPNSYLGYCTHAILKSRSNTTVNTFRYDINENNTRFAIDFAEYGTTNLATFKDFLDANGVMCAYILAIPIETPLSEDELAQYRALHSNYPVTTILNDSEAHMEVKYNADTKTYIDNKFAELQAALVALGGN